MSDLLLNMNNISKSFPGVRALDNVSIDLKSGEVLGLLGENGAGKSTLIKILSGDFSMDGGEILIDGAKFVFHSPHDSQMQGIRVIYQELISMDTLTVAENIFAGMLPRKRSGLVDWGEMNRRSREVLSRLKVDINPKKLVGDLSIHQKQIVEIAKAINKQAKILVMDEPTAALGQNDIRSLFEVIRNLREQGVGIIYISHRLEEVFQITDRVTVLRDGKKVGTVNTRDTDKNTLISMMVGRELESFFAEKEVSLGETLLEVKNLTIKDIVDDISFDLKKGEILGLFGLLGSGRLNIARALYGLESVDGGEILLQGKRTAIHSPRQAVQSTIGFLPIDRKKEGLALSLNVHHNITMANIDNLGNSLFISRQAEQVKAKKWVKDLNIKTPSIYTEMNNLSGGNQQKVVLAKLLETGSRVFIMIEPTRGIDVGAKSEIYILMEKLCEQGAGILMISSELPEMLSMSDRIIVIAEGRVTGRFDKTTASQEKLLAAATG
ncbi:MAG TPA: sugar ABC transporter ATP-binding protein [Atribacteraceae bacterium]|nr:sugar ABC transporter ATP-binding protein [Atribacteraceae bacterium]